MKQNLLLNKEIIIIGAGASGLFSAIFLKKKNYNVIVLEKNSKAGRKILASGNGKCNITNKNISNKFFNTSHDKHFVQKVLDNMPYTKIKKLFSDIGLEMQVGDGTRMYPASMQASSVSDILYSTAVRYGVKFKFTCEVTSISKKNNEFKIITNENIFLSKYLVVASGSAAMKKLGSSNSGYEFAKYFNHNIVNQFASLVQLRSDDKSIYALNGVKSKSNVSLIINSKCIQTLYGDILFTKYGLSGNTILDLSRKASQALNNKKHVEIYIDIIPNHNHDDVHKLLLKRQTKLKELEIRFLLESVINTKLIGYIYEKANVKVKYIKHLSKNDILNIVLVIKKIIVEISSTNGFDNAEVTAGGISLEDINENDMQSKKEKNLYFCGEVLDVDGDCGGYNFHWAWASAYTLAQSFK